MFTGIVEEVGTVEQIRRDACSAVLTVRAGKILSDLSMGDSVAVNGVCLTAARILSSGFQADVMHETLDRSSLGELRAGSHVNLERAMPAWGRFGGHLVTGHIDGTGIISEVKRDGNALWYSIKAGPELLRLMVEKGSVAVDGISLTVARVLEGEFQVSVIPHTAFATILREKRAKDTVNLENDIMAKYAERLLNLKQGESGEKAGRGGLTEQFLKQNGF